MRVTSTQVYVSKWLRRSSVFNKAGLFESTGEHSGLLVSFWLPQELADRVALDIPDAEKPEDLHITLAYVPDTSGIPDENIARAIDILFGMKGQTPLPGEINGYGRFNAALDSDGKDAFFAVPDVPGIDSLHSMVCSILCGAGVEPAKNHAFNPHITLAYLDPSDDTPLHRWPGSIPITIDSISISLGDRRTIVPFITATEEGEGTPEEEMVDTMETEMEGNELKAIQMTTEELRVGNYIALFGGRDLEGIVTKRRNPDGSTGEFFTKNTQFESSYTDLGVLYVDWEHGYDEEGPDPDDVLGYVDWKTARMDEKGLFVERVLNRRNRYVKFIEQLIVDGMIGTSSQAIPNRVKKGVNGEIKVWPLKRDTLTVQPMEPRMITQNSLSALKALSQRHPALKSIVDQIDLGAIPEVSRSKAVTTAQKDTGSEREADRLAVEIDLLLLENSI